MIKVTVEKDGELMYSEEARLAVVNLQGLKDEDDANLLNITGEGPGKVLVLMKLVGHVVHSILEDVKDPDLQALAMHGLIRAIESAIEKYKSTQADNTDEDALENKPIPLYHS